MLQTDTKANKKAYRKYTSTMNELFYCDRIILVILNTVCDKLLFSVFLFCFSAIQDHG